MRIVVMLNKLSFGGVQRIAIDDCNEMIRQGHDVYLITTEEEDQNNTIESECLVRREHRILIPFRGTADISALRTLTRLLRRLRPDVVITHMWLANNVGRLGSLFACVPRIIVFEHSVYSGIKTTKQFVIDFLFQMFTEKIIAVSESVKRSLQSHGIMERKICVLHNAITLDRFRNKVDVAAMREELGVPSGAFLLITIGRLHHVKRIDWVVRALCDLSGCFLGVIGDGAERSKLMELTKKIGVADRVLFLGNRSDIPDLLRASDCMILPSGDREGFGIVMLEAMASAVPVVVANYPAATEVVKDRKNGRIFMDAPSLIAAVRDIMNSGTVRSDLIKNGLLTVERYGIYEHVQELLSLHKRDKT